MIKIKTMKAETMLFILMAVLTVILIGTYARAEEISVPNLKLPNIQAGMIYSIQEGRVEACTTATVLKYPTKIGDVELRAGYAIENTPIAALTFKVGDLSQFGFEQPLHKLINLSLGAYVGYDLRDNGGFDYGLTASIIEVAF